VKAYVSHAGDAPPASVRARQVAAAALFRPRRWAGSVCGAGHARWAIIRVPRAAARTRQYAAIGRRRRWTRLPDP